MKIHSILLLFILGCISLPGWGNENVNKLILEARNDFYNSVKSFDTQKIIEAEHRFERILYIDDKSYITHYYIALIDEQIVHSIRNDSKLKTQYIDKAIDHLEKCIEINKDFSEAYILLAGVYGVMMSIDRTAAVSLSSKAANALKTAMKLDNNNPRAYLVAGRSAFYTPEVFGGGIKKAKEYINRSIELFETYKSPDPVYPVWGFDEAYAYSGQIAAQENLLVDARNDYLKALEINPYNSYVKYYLLPLLEHKMNLAKPLFIPESGYFAQGDSIRIEMENGKYAMYYTLDGGIPTVHSLKYEAPLFIKKDALVKAVTIADDGSESGIAEAKYTIGKPMEPVAVDDLKKNIHYCYYEGDWNKLPDFNTMTPLDSGTVNKISLHTKKRDDRFAFVFDGYIKIENSGAYTFFLGSDDGSKLIINDELIIDNDGMHSYRKKSRQILLNKGFHSIKVLYFENNGDELLTLTYRGPEMSIRELDESVLFHK